ncbi:MAG: hypothetical protein QXZ41_03495 [Ignisphaera sp.]
MGVCWSNLVEEIFSRVEELLILCSSCSSEDPCIYSLSMSSPMDIQVLDGCCACIFENILESMQNVYRVYSSNEFKETIAVYKLDDVIIELSPSTVTIVPIAKLSAYIEVLEESGDTSIDTIKSLLAEFPSDVNPKCGDKP